MIARTGDEPRPVNPFLMAGLLICGPLFFWFLLRPGYARSTRLAALSYILVPFAFACIYAVLSGE